MADYNAKVSSGKQTLTPDTIDTVTFDRDIDYVEVWASGLVTFTVDRTDPGSDSTYVIPVAGVRQVKVPTAGNTEVRLLASTTVDYVVTGV